ncbi:hypothetical protein HW132_12910 [Brasilonema sp. CT11]|nr:hypothetical protein [Brasilonema sp. CT11]
MAWLGVSWGLMVFLEVVGDRFTGEWKFFWERSDHMVFLEVVGDRFTGEWKFFWERSDHTF